MKFRPAFIRAGWVSVALVASLIIPYSASATPTPATSAPTHSASATCVKKGTAQGRTTTPTELSEAFAIKARSGMPAQAVEDAIADDWCLRRLPGSKDPEADSAQTRTPGSESTTVSASSLEFEPSHPQDIAFNNVSLFYDDDVDHYYAMGTYNWTTNSYIRELPEDECVPTPLGGVDGVGIRVTGTKYQPTGSSLTIWGSSARDAYDNDFEIQTFAGIKNQPGAASYNEWGTTFRVQDYIVNGINMGECWYEGSPWDFSMHNGAIVYGFDQLNSYPCEYQTAYMVYGHSYQEITVNGFNASTDGFGFSWDVQDKSWESGAAPSPSVLICRNGTGGGSGGGSGGEPQALNDYNGDSRTDFAVFRPSSGYWGITYTSGTGNSWASGGSANALGGWGGLGDIPVPGDYNGDNKTDFAVFRPTTGYWAVTYSSGGSVNALSGWGQPGDIPIPGDYNGDGKTDFALFRPSNGGWYVTYNYAGGPSVTLATGWGGQGDIPIPGDYNGDGRTDAAVFRPSSGYWAILYTGGGGVSALSGWGGNGDIPLPGDYNGDGRTDFAIFRPSVGYWAITYTGGSGNSWASGGGVSALGGWGGNGDTPLGAPPMVRFTMAGAVSTYTITAQHSGQCLDVVDASIVNGARIQQWQCNGSSQQKWDLVPATGGTYLLRNRNSGKCLDVYNANQADGTSLQQWDCNSVTQQQFTVPTPGTWATIGVYGKCLDITAGSNTMGARLQLWTCLGNLNQSYKLTQTS